MPFQPPPSQATAAHRATQGADAGRVADAAASNWRGIEAALAPIIGKRGVAALYQRSLYLVRLEHPCLADVHEGALQPGEFAALHAALAQQPGPSAEAASQALQQTFIGLLSDLIGEALTRRLVKSVWDNPDSGPATQDTTP